MLARFDCLLSLTPGFYVVISKVIEVNALLASDFLQSTTRLFGWILDELIVHDAALLLVGLGRLLSVAVGRYSCQLARVIIVQG